MRKVLLHAACVLAPAAPLRAAEAADAHGYSLRTDLAFWSLLTFVLFVLVIRKMGWAGFVGGLARREARERDLVAAAEAQQAEAEGLLRQQQGRMEAIDEEVKEMIAEAHRDAAYTKSELLAAAQRETQAINARADVEIGRARDHALDDIFDKFMDRIIKQSEQNLAGRLSAGDQQRLIDDALNQFATANQK